MSLTTLQKECLSTANLKECVRIGENDSDVETVFYPKQTVHKLIRIGFLEATDWFNQYVITSDGVSKCSKFRKVYSH